MILKDDVHHPNDVSMKYMQIMQPEKLYHYLNLPGEFDRTYPNKLIRRDGSEREMDWLCLVKPDYEVLFEEILVNIEFQSKSVNLGKIRTIADYRDYAKTNYGLPVLSVIVINVDPRNSVKQFEKTSSDILKPLYIYIDGEEVKERFKNLEIKINNHENLNDDEALDIAFLPMFAPKGEAKKITEEITYLFKKDSSIKGKLRNDVAYVLAIMIRKYFDGTKKGKELLNMVENVVRKSDLIDVIEYELDYRDKTMKRELKNLEKEFAAEKDAEIARITAEKDAEIAELKAKLKENGID